MTTLALRALGAGAEDGGVWGVGPLVAVAAAERGVPPSQPLATVLADQGVHDAPRLVPRGFVAHRVERAAVGTSSRSLCHAGSMEQRVMSSTSNVATTARVSPKVRPS